MRVQDICLKEIGGGLGNQLFQLATLASFGKELGCEIFLPKQLVSPGYVDSPIYNSTLF
jgi:hypothetical protein